jgi:hypothetical protein
VPPRGRKGNKLRLRTAHLPPLSVTGGNVCCVIEVPLKDAVDEAFNGLCI